MRDNRKRYLERRRKKSSHTSIPKKIVVPEKDNMGCFTTIMVTSFFPSSITVLMVFRILDLTKFQFLQLFALILAISFFIPIRLYRKKLTISFYEYTIFNFISITPMLLALIFSLNIIFTGNTYVETYSIVKREPSKYQYVYTLADNQYEDKKYLRTIYSNNYPNITGFSKYSIYFQDGMFGIRVIEKKLAH